MALLQKAYLGATPLFREPAWFENQAIKVVQRVGSFSLTADTNAHTKGAWTQLFSSTTADASVFWFIAQNVNTNATNTATLLDIGTGDSGSETTIIENVAIGSATANGVVAAIPFKIPSGTRIAARIQSVVTGGKTANIVPHILDGGDYATAPTSVDTIGADTATSQGASFSGASGTWAEGIASTSRAYRAVALILSAHSDDLVSSVNGVFEIGVGAAGSEVSFGRLYHTYFNSEQSRTELPYFQTFGRSIPAGSRLAVKHPIVANPDRYGFTLIGIP
jgi:hypothetical protein